MRKSHAARACVLWSTLLAVLASSGCDSGAGTRRNEPPAPATDTTAPTAPATLSATAVSATRIDLSWTAATDQLGVTGYRVYRNAAATELASVTATTHSDTTVVAGTAYSYVVRAVDAAGNLSNPSPTATATTPGTSPTGPSGLDARPSNTTCLAWDRPTAGSAITVTRFTNLTFNAPLGLLQAPTDDVRWFVVEQGGIVRSFNGGNPGAATDYVNLTDRVASGGELGLLGMAFHPDYPTDGRVFLSYTNNQSGLVSRVSSFRSTDGGATLNPTTEQILLTVNQPEANHNGGHIAFGPDRYLYIGLGDGGGAGDEHGNPGNGQRLTTLLGKLLRIDVNGAAPYTVPECQSILLECQPWRSMSRSGSHDRRLPGNLRVGLSQSVALEFRSCE